MITEEIWKDIPGYEGLYQASFNGRGHTIEWLEEVAIKNWNQRIKIL